MKLSRRNNLTSRIAMGLVHANVNFAGVPSNFNFNPGGGGGGGGGNGTPNAPAPMSGAAGNIPPANPSKMIPGMEAGTPGDPNNPNNKPPEGSSPLDKYAGFFDNKPKPVDPNAPKPTPTVLDATSADYLKTAGKLDFTAAVTPEQRALMAKGGEEGVTAMLDAINGISRNIYAQAGATASQVTKKGLELSEGQLDSKINQSLVLAQSSSNVGTLNSMLENPMYKPMVGAIQQHFLTVKPDMTAKELSELTVDYFKNMSAPAASTKEDSGGKTNMESFFEGL